MYKIVLVELSKHNNGSIEVFDENDKFVRAIHYRIGDRARDLYLSILHLGSLYSPYKLYYVDHTQQRGYLDVAKFVPVEFDIIMQPRLGE